VARRRRLIKHGKPPAKAVRYVNAWWDGKAIRAVEAMADGGRRIRRIRGEVSNFIRGSVLSRDLRRELSKSRAIYNFAEEGDWVRIRWRDRGYRYQACKTGEGSRAGWFARQKIETFEGDVDPVSRWMADGEAEIARPRRCYLDIETDSRLPFSKKHKMRILCWAVVDEDGGVSTGLLRSEDDEAERDLLSELFTVLAEFDQVLAWYGDGFDFPVIRARAKHCKIKFNFDRLLWLDHMAWFKKANMMAAESGDEKQSMALNEISTSLGLGGKEEGVVGADSWPLWESGSKGRAKLLRYCVRDTDLMRLIEGETGYVEMLNNVCQLCHLFPDSRAASPQARVDAFMLRLGRQRGIRFPTRQRFNDSPQDKFRGAFVMRPTTLGILHDVHVADFKGMYPSIIISWNMSPDTKIDKPEATRNGRPASACPSYLSHYPLVPPVLPDYAAESPITGVWFDQREQGLLPFAVQQLVDMREQYKQAKKKATPGSQEWTEADRISTALKIAVNSFYGVIGSQMSRFFDREVAESVTQAGVWLIKETLKKLEADGVHTLYGDTDSAMLMGVTNQRMAQLVDECNDDLYPQLMSAQQARDNRIALDFEKSFSRMILVGKKRYCATYSHYGGTAATAESKPEIKGLEFKRGDTVKLCRVMQQEVIERLLSNEDRWDEPETYVEILKGWLERLLTEPLEADLVKLSKSLSKPLSAYKRKTKKDGTQSKLLPHLEIAHEMKKRGEDVGEGTKISYYCADASKSDGKIYKHVGDWDDDCDRFELWEATVWPASRRVLEVAFPAHQWGSYDKVRPKKHGRLQTAGRRLAEKLVGDQGVLFE